MSDLHLCDAASPARLEFLDRLADPDSPLSALVPYVGTYRAQEFLTTQVLEAMVRAANEITHAPMTGAPIDAVVITGDVTDNAQSNELTWYKSILEGGSINPKSGHEQKSEAAHSSNPENYDIHFYHPDGPPAGMEADRPHTLHGFPHYKGLLDASEAQFIAEGMQHQWLAVHGNHDALLKGTAAPTPLLNELVQGN
jgi:3',5'-cyclic AMP phosphodiesterase CpdA